MGEKLSEVVSAWKKAESVLVFTGAGMSAESGIPTFRGPGGLWDRFDPEKTAYLPSFLKNPQPFWEMARELFLQMNVRPNKGHQALSNLEKNGYLEGIITQNIDGLHQKAGSGEVYELHGSLEKLDCLDCKRELFWEMVSKDVEKGKVKCNCGSRKVKPRIVFFGESLPPEVFSKALELAERCDFMVVVGSSLEVYPAASIPQIARENGAKMLLVNQDKTAFDEMFHWVFRETAGKILPDLEEKILGGDLK